MATPTNKLRLLLADDHTLFLDGMRGLLERESWLTLVGTASTGEEVLRKLHSHYVDVLLLDLHMPGIGGIETAAIVADRYPDVRIIIISMHSERTFIERMFRVGVAGYLLKNTSRDELLTAIRAVRDGRRYFAHDVTAAVLGEALGAAPAQLGPDALTKREVEVLQHIARGLTNKDIATYLHLSVQTVHTHRKNIMQKLQVNNSAALVRYAMSNGLID